jgi:hypothetical protein
MMVAGDGEHADVVEQGAEGQVGQSGFVVVEVEGDEDGDYGGR